MSVSKKVFATLLILCIFNFAMGSKSFGATTQKPVAAPEANVNSLTGVQLGTIPTALKQIWIHGLNPNHYWTAAFENANQTGTLETLQNDLLATYLQALKDVYVGTIDPSKLSSDIIFKRKDFLKDDQLKALVTSSQGDAAVLLNQVASQFPQYLALEEAMKRLYPAVQNGTWQALPVLQKTLRLGVKDPMVLLLKQRLAQYGYSITSTDNNYDEQTRQAVVDVQYTLKFTPDGVVSPGGKTWAYLSVPATTRIQQVQADMEKMRWLNQTPEDRYVFVNTAFTTFSLTDKITSTYMNFKTINGRPERKTPSMKDKIVYVIFNPFWTIPPTVFIQDKVSHLAGMDWWQIQDYFDQNHFTVVDDNDRPMDPTYIDWSNIRNANVDFYIKQYPNYMNALGVVKFMLTNPYAIYLHDTDERERFPEANRLFSSGCIRLEKPLDFAQYLLQGTQWTREKIDNFVVKPGEVLSQETRVNISSSLPVYILPVTSQVFADNVLRFTSDVYGHNQLIAPKLQQMEF